MVHPHQGPRWEDGPPCLHTLDKNILSAAVDGHQLSVGCGGAWGLGLLGPRGERGSRDPESGSRAASVTRRLAWLGAEGIRPEAGTGRRQRPWREERGGPVSPELQRIIWWEKVGGARVQPRSLCSYTLQ